MILIRQLLVLGSGVYTHLFIFHCNEDFSIRTHLIYSGSFPAAPLRCTEQDRHERKKRKEKNQRSDKFEWNVAHFDGDELTLAGSQMITRTLDYEMSKCARQRTAVHVT